MTVINSIISLGVIAVCAAIILFLVSKKFEVKEDLRISQVADLLPGINCGNCGFPSCREMASSIIKNADQGDIGDLYCPVGGDETMQEIGVFLDLEVNKTNPVIAVVCCNGSKDDAPVRFEYDGPQKCSIIHALFTGESSCPYGCLRCGDCVKACDFDAIFMDDRLGLPIVKEDKCVGCGACVRACPRDIIELRPKGRKNRRVWVACNYKEKGGKPLKSCKVACIGCQKCGKACPEKVQAISFDDFKAYIDPIKCIACRKCIAVCPTKAILANFEPPRPMLKIEKKVEEQSEREKER